MDESTVFGGLFVFPWIWVILQVVVFGNTFYVAYLVLFCLVWDYLKTEGFGGANGKTASGERTETGDLVADGESFEPVETSAVAPGVDGFTADGDNWTPAVMPIFGEGWFPEAEPDVGDNWTPMAVTDLGDNLTPVTIPDFGDTWTPAVTPIFGEGWFPEDKPDDLGDNWTPTMVPDLGDNLTPLTIPDFGENWSPVDMPIFEEDWFPEDESDDENNWTPVALPDIGHNWTPARRLETTYSGDDWFPAYGVNSDPVTSPRGHQLPAKLKIGDFRWPKTTPPFPPVPGKRLYSVPAVNSGAKKTGLKARGLKLLHRVKKLIERKRMNYRRF